jgi:hypothetical protein
MYATDITLAGDSSSTRTYALRSIVDGNSVRANASAPANEPETLTIKHSASKRKDGTVINRHLVRADLTKVNSTTQLSQTGSCQVVFENPTDSAITLNHLKDMRTQLVNFLTDANLAKLINSEP